MSTYWIDYTNGDDANDGLSYANAKKNWKAGIDAARAAGVGNTVNIVGPVTIPSSGGAVTLSGFSGATGYDSGFGIRIQGTDTNGDPLMAEVNFQDDAVATAALSLSSNANFIDIRGLYVNWSANATACLTKHFISVTSTSANGLRVKDCIFERGPNAYGGLVNFSSLSSDDCKIQYNMIIENGTPVSNPLLLGMDDRGQLDLDHNVFIVYGAINGNLYLVNLGSHDANLTDHAITYNTFYFHTDVSIGGNFSPIISTDSLPLSGTPAKEVRNNVVYYASDISPTGMTFMLGNGTNSSANYSLQMGYNLFAYNAANSWASATGQPYQVPWDPDDDDSPEGTSTWTGDAEITSDPFFDLGNPYAWGMSGAGWTATVPYDLRINDPYRTNSSSGGVPGAIPDSIAVPTPAEIDVTPTSIAFGNQVVDTTDFGTITITNLGELDLTISSCVLAGDAAFTDESAATSGVLAFGEQLVLTINFTPTTQGAHSATVTISSDDSDEPTVVVTLTGTGVSSVKVPQPTPNPLPISPISPASPAYYDPMDRNSGIQLAVRVHKNTTQEHQLKVQGPTVSVSSVAVGYIILPSGTALTSIPVTVSGATVFALETDQPVSVQLNAYTFTLLEGGFFLAGGCDLTTFKLANSGPRDAVVKYYGSK